MEHFNISANQIADFHAASERRRISIIKQQRAPNKFKIPWYQSAKSSIRKMIKAKGDLTPILDGIDKLKNKKPEKKRQIIDRRVSIEALERVVRLKLPKLLNNIDYEVLKRPKINFVLVKGVEVIVSPEIIIRGEIDGKIYYGAVKIHISKTKPFDLFQSRIVSSLVYKYLIDNIVKEGELVLPDLCLSIDVFGDRVCSCPIDFEKYLESIEIMCEQIKLLWDAA